MISVESVHRAQYKKQFSQTSTGPEVSLRSSFGRAQVEGTFALPSLFPPSSVLIRFHVTRRKWAALMVLLSPPRRDLHPHLPCLHTRLQLAVSVFSSRNHASRCAFSEPSNTKTTAGLSLLCSRHPSTQHPAGGPLQQGRVAPAVVTVLTRCWMLANCVINKCAQRDRSAIKAL